jgi:hypothetical protein
MKFPPAFPVKNSVDTPVPVYKPRSRNVIQTILKNHFSDFEKYYDDHYADKYGKYRIIRFKQAVEKFIEFGDYSKGIARIKCTNPECGYEYFRPFSCKSWYLCPSCNQKRLQLFAEHFSENLLLKASSSAVRFYHPQAPVGLF